MTDAQRVLALLRNAYRDRGLAAPDVLSTPIDGGKPILRLAARIKDLRNEGHEIETVGRRNRCAVYRLAGVPGQQAVGRDRGLSPPLAAAASAGQEQRSTGVAAPAVPEPASLFDDPPETFYDRERAA